jgi:hypothetical protein
VKFVSFSAPSFLEGDLSSSPSKKTLSVYFVFSCKRERTRWPILCFVLLIGSFDAFILQTWRLRLEHL